MAAHYKQYLLRVHVYVHMVLRVKLYRYAASGWPAATGSCAQLSLITGSVLTPRMPLPCHVQL